MKTITLKVVVPEWAKWVATDASGRVFAYRRKPIQSEIFNHWNGSEVVGSKFVLMTEMCKTTPPKDWRKTLRKIGGRK